ncbi:MAG: hypothetical protein ACK4EY_16220 [Flavipsychrobacter sp.]
MKNSKVILSFFGFCLTASFIAHGASLQFGINPLLSMLGLTALAIVGGITKSNTQHSTTMTACGVEKEIWVDAIVKRFFKNNAFLKNFKNHNDYVLAGKVVHMPQQGTRPTVVKGRSSYPATAAKRTDGELTYLLEEYTTDPTHIPNAEKIELSYDKIMDVIGDHIDTLSEVAADDFIIKLLTTLPGAFVVDTTGASTAVGVTGQTGTRAAMVHTDLQKAALIMNKANVPREGRFAMLEANMLDQLYTSLANTQYRDFSQYANAAEGIVGKLHGFQIIDRSLVAGAATALSSGNLAVNALGAAYGATDDIVSIAWQKDCAAHAIGEVQLFENINDATYYGDVYSASLRNGGRRLRSDNAGIVAIKQGHA